MSKLIALCVGTPASQNNRIFDAQWVTRFPGLQAMPILAGLIRRAGHEIVTGDIALSHVHNGYWKAKDITIIQEMDSASGLELIRLGAEAKVLSALESPIFAYPFYDRLSELGPMFEHRILFRGTFSTFFSQNGHNHTTYFPAFHRNNLSKPMPWNQRKFMVMVAANKHYNRKVRFPLSLNPARYVKWHKKRQIKENSSALQTAVKNELQTKRYEAVEYFGGSGRMDLFGFGWDRLSKMPKEWQKRLGKFIRDKNPKPCDDKIETIRKYKFAICFENTSYPGYVTEKIIDCLVAGVIPIYFGAEDITDFVPKQAFIDMRRFDSWKQLDDFIESISEEQAMETIKNGQNFLYSEQGQRHSFENHAELVFELIDNKLNKKEVLFNAVRKTRYV